MHFFGRELVLIYIIFDTTSGENNTNTTISQSTVLTSTLVVPNTTGTPLTTIKTNNTYTTTGVFNITNPPDTTSICQKNGTCNETVNLNATTPIPTTTLPTTPKSDIFLSKVTNKKTKEGCSCNLQFNFCDINCCCDVDCSLEKRLVFDHCEREENRYIDTRYCKYIQHIYLNNTSYEWEVNNNGLFCIVSSNLPPSYTLQKKQPLKTYDKAFLQKTGRYSWFSQKSGERNTVFNSTMSLKYGSPLWIIQNNRLDILKISQSRFTTVCNVEEQVKYLKNLKSMCSSTDVSEDNAKLNVNNYFSNIQVISAPSMINSSKFYDGHFQGCPKNICLPIQTKLCDEHLNLCVNITKPDKKLEPSCTFDLLRNQNSCKNVVKKVKYNVYHNGIEGIKRVELLTVLTLITYTFEPNPYEHYINFEVNFLWYNQTKNITQQLSGNPGYIIGKHILIGELRNFGNETNTNFKIHRNSLNYQSTFLVFGKSVQGICVLTNDVYMPIEFGFNMFTKCTYSVEIIKSKNENGTDICKIIQKNLLSNWNLAEKVNKSYGLFGNANMGKLEDWWPILFEESIETLLNKSIGNFSNKNETLTCLNIISGVNIDIYHSRVDFKDLVNQEKILGITFKFDIIENSTLKFQHNKTNFETTLKTRVMFYDITAHKRKKFVDPPSFEIKLPYDFFYPFVRVYESKGSRLQFSFVFLGIVCYLF